MLRKPFSKKTGSPVGGREEAHELELGSHLAPLAPDSGGASGVLEPGPGTLEMELWFHGVLPREEVVRLLQDDGDFLVRETTRNEQNQTVLSVMWGSPKHFIVQLSPEGHFRFEGPAFHTIQELIMHQFQSGNSLNNRAVKEPFSQ